MIFLNHELFIVQFEKIKKAIKLNIKYNCFLIIIFIKNRVFFKKINRNVLET